MIFFVISFVTNILGSLNPEMIKSFQLSLSLSSLLPFAFFIAYGVMSIPAGMLVEKYKEKKIILAAFVVSFIGALMFVVFPSYIVFLPSLFLMGSGVAMLQVAINPLLRVSGGEEHFAFNSVMAQLVFGGASFVAPMFLTYLVSNVSSGESGNGLFDILRELVPKNIVWSSIYWVIVLLLLLMIIIISFSKFPTVERKDDEKSGSWETHKSLFRNKIVILYFIGIFAYVGIEQGVSYWLSKFLSTYHGFDPLITGTSVVGWFWGLMSIGCLVGLGLLKLFDSRKILVAASVLTIILLSIALFGPGNISIIVFPLIGFSLSVMWSIIFSLALNSINNHHGSFAGILCTAIIGGAIIQLFIGWIGDLFGLRLGMSFIFILLAYILSIGIWAKPLIVNETITLNKTKNNE